MSSDEEDVINLVAHKQLLSEISEIVKFQHIKKPIRNEPALKNTEFYLVKSNSSSKVPDEKRYNKNVSISSVAQTVQKNTKQKQIGNQLKNAFKSENVLGKPLEKVYADRIKRTIAYNNTRTKLARWDAIVTKNQNSEQLQFPLILDKTKIKKNDPDVQTFRYKTQMMKDLEGIKGECFSKHQHGSADHATESIPELLTLEEMAVRRKELGKLKLKESHKIAKKRQQGKIKSKKYHKLKKREELKKKMKEFEELKATNPEAALKELDKIERQRVQERTTLRHKNTGTWAKNLQVRSKYDANVRQDLESQLTLGRELTQKIQQSDLSESEEEETVAVISEQNPWLGSKQFSDPLDEVFSGYKKFWEQHNATQKQLKQAEVHLKKSIDVKKKIKEAAPSIEPAVESDEPDSEDENSSKFINDLFDHAEDKLLSKMELKLSALKPTLLEEIHKNSVKNSGKKRTNIQDSSNYLGFQKQAKLGDIDAALNEEEEVEASHIPTSVLLKEIKQKKEEKKTFMRGTDDINPESFLNVKSRHLITGLPKTQDFDDAHSENDIHQLSKANKLSLAEAFENDDIIFEQDFEDENKKNIVRDEDDNILPGWGAWGGEGVKARLNECMKKIQDVRKKDRIIISNAVNEKLQKHLISSVPFPFKSVQDFEASMRLPIGRDFIPETAHRKLTLPNVVTKVGTIIEPMSDSSLIQDGSTKRKFMKRDKKGNKIRK